MFTLIVPFHRDVARLDATLARLDEGRSHGITETLFCHNGPRLEEDVWRPLASRMPQGARLLHTDAKGIGAGYRIGIEAARERFVVLSASDLPFGFTDVDAFEAERNRGVEVIVAIGSKAHRASRIAGYGWKRRAASKAFYLLRRTLLGRGTPQDSQGTIIAETALAQRIARQVRADDYFFSVEFLTLCARAGAAPLELPVELVREQGESSVHLLHDSIALAKQTWRLRQRLREEMD